MKKILIPTKLNKIAEKILTEKEYLVVLDSETPLNELIQAHSDTEALIIRSEKITKEIIDSLPDLKTIVRAGAGYDNIDSRYARMKKIDVMNTPGANANGVAEEVIAMMMASARHLIPADQSTRSGLWEKKKFSGTEIAGKTVGIVGLGAIGQFVCKRLSGFEVNLLGFDPFISADKAKDLNIQMTSLKELFQKSDYITLHVPQNDETRGMVNQSLLTLMKEGATLINCARAGILNEEDLRKVKQTKNIRFCNDVYHKDAPGEKTVKDISDIMLPHLGASTLESNFNAAKRSAEQLIDLWEKGITRYVVNSIIPDDLDENYQNLCFHITRLARAWLGENPVHQIEVSFYGKLEKHAKWMISPIVSALDPSFDILSDHNEALEHLKEKGINYLNREADNTKKYGESVTVDLFCGENKLDRISIRGTLTEGALMISRIADFEKLYFDPRGHSLFFTYSDRPAVLGKITSILGNTNINIHDIRAPHNLTRDKSIAIIKIDKSVEKDIILDINKTINAETGFYLNL